MQTNPISFGKRIPLVKGQVYNKRTQRNIDVTLYECDCKDFSDTLHMNKAIGKWYYKDLIRSGISYKYKYPEDVPNFYYYTLENNNNQIIGMAEIENSNNCKFVNLIETDNSNTFKFAGQVMLSAIGKLIMNNNEDKLIVDYPVPEAMDFYKKACGFKNCKDSVHIDYPDTYDDSLEMNRKQISKFIKQTEERTNHPLIDLKV